MSTPKLSPEPPEKAAAGIAEHIVRTAGVCGGRPHIAGHRIKVSQVVLWHERQGQSARDIVAEHPGLSLADVYAALAYYHDRPDEIDAELAAAEEVYEHLRAQQPSLLERLAARRPDPVGLSNAAALAYVRLGQCPAEDLKRLQSDLPRRQAASPADPDVAELQEELAERLAPR